MNENLINNKLLHKQTKLEIYFNKYTNHTRW